MTVRRRIIVAITGATGVIYGIRLLEILKSLKIVESHLIVSDPAKHNIGIESDKSVAEILALSDYNYSNENIAAPISSGSFKTDSMVVIPCSMNTMSSIANGIADNLILRSSDVILKERRRLVLVVRETPLHYGHLSNMLRLTQMGAIIAPPVPAFYNNPSTVDDIINQTVGRILDLINIEHHLNYRWE